MSKCDNCRKNITKTFPGLECSKCERLVHLNPKCTGLTNKQIAAIQAAPSLEWTCLVCQQETPRRNSSIVIPEDEEEEDGTTVQIDAKKLLANITKEVEKAIKNEMAQLNDSLQFHSAKLDEAVICIETFKKTIKILERKNNELMSKNNNLETRVGALEQRLQELEQEKLAKFVEVANVPKSVTENVQTLTENIALSLKLSKDHIKSSRRLANRKEQPGNILVELVNENIHEKWLSTAKTSNITVADILPTDKNNHKTIYIREAMTKYNKQLFWNAKQELKINKNFKYVWFKAGHVKARKDDGEKIITLRTLTDIRDIVNRME